MIEEPLKDWRLGSVLLQTGAFKSKTEMYKAVKQGQINYGPYDTRKKATVETLEQEICDLTTSFTNSLAVRTGKGSGLAIYMAGNDKIWFDKGW